MRIAECKVQINRIALTIWKKTNGLDPPYKKMGSIVAVELRDDINWINPLLKQSKYSPEWAEEAFDWGDKRVDSFFHQIVELVLSHFTNSLQVSSTNNTTLCNTTVVSLLWPDRINVFATACKHVRCNNVVYPAYNEQYTTLAKRRQITATPAHVMWSASNRRTFWHTVI